MALYERLLKFGRDDGKWVYDRIMVVDCPNVISKEQQDKQLLEKMYAERRGIVKKTVKALQTVIANGYRFTEPDSIAEARRDYQSANSTVISFYEECMCPWENGKIVRHCTTGGYTRYIRLGAGRTIMVMPELQKSSENSLQDILVVRLLM